ncbi:hypothetical protein ACGF3J_02780 [Streptomyces sp. NPDC048171]|uniref:DUF7878 domain-containing protein n=1 Tax=unclassified Streptomyces TaxID=2593676 RepID=UPI00136AE82B|nr:hypothetical protein [Streptomyces sp. SID5789]MZE68901.1 hypothetical protein [Streptomyces sp. SID5789]
MRMLYQGVNARDLRGSTVADYLVNIEAHFEVVDEGEVIYSELDFPVAELARELTLWISVGESDASDFSFSSISFEEPGAVVISRSPDGWEVGSMFTPTVKSEPIDWPTLSVSVEEFVARVQRDIAGMGIDPSFIRP